MSILDENRNYWMGELKKARDEILSSSTFEVMVLRMNSLRWMLSKMESATTGELKQTVQRTQEELNRVMMYDATRADVCKWVQTLICELNITEK